MRVVMKAMVSVSSVLAGRRENMRAGKKVPT